MMCMCAVCFCFYQEEDGIRYPEMSRGLGRYRSDYQWLVVVRVDADQGHIPKEAAHNVFEQTDSLLLYQLIDHIAKNGSDRVKALVRLANVGQAHVIQQYLLNNEYCDGLAEFRAGFHYAQA